MNITYPTPKKIMDEKIILIDEEIKYLKMWKKEWWKSAKKATTKKDYQKILAIRMLLESLCVIHGTNKRKYPRIIYNPRVKSTYNHETKTIYLQNTSIITALHELAHYLYGSNELIACAYSIHLFKSTFPKAFRKLEWKGHLLINKRKEQKNEQNNIKRNRPSTTRQSQKNSQNESN